MQPRVMWNHKRILKKGEKSHSDMKKKAEGKVDAAADKFIKEFLESLS